MKKMFCLVLILLIVFVLSACADKTGGASFVDDSNTTSLSITDEDMDRYFNTFQNFENSFNRTLVENDNYIIKQSDEYAGDFYRIYDNNRNLLDKGYHSYRGSFDISKKNNLVTLEYGFGGTNVFPLYKFYDIEKGKVSRYFEGPISTNENSVAYFIANDDRTVLVVQDIFDIDKFYKEFTGYFDKSIFMRINEISFSEDGTKIIIKHSDINNERDIIEEIFQIK